MSPEKDGEGGGAAGIGRGGMGGGIFPTRRLSASHLCIKIIAE